MISVKKSVSIVMISSFFAMFLNYVFNVYMGWLLTPEEFGIIGVFLALFSLLSLFITHSFPWALAKFISEDYSSRDETIKYKIFRSSLVGNVSIALIASGIFYLFTTTVFKSEVIYYKLALYAILMVIVASVKNIYRGILHGTFRFTELSFLSVLEVALKLIISVGLIYYGLGVFGPIFGMFISFLVVLSINIYFTKDFKFWQEKGFENFKIFRFAVPLILATFGMSLIQNLDILGVKMFTELSASNTQAGLYQSALIISRIPLFIAGAIGIAIFPYVSSNSKNNLNYYSNKSLRFGILFIFPISIAISLIPTSFIRLFFPEYYIQSHAALSIISLGMGFLSIVGILEAIFQANGIPQVPAKILISVPPLQLLLLKLLVPTLGLTGAAMSTAIVCFVAFLLLGVNYVKRYDIRPCIRESVKFSVSIAISGIFILIFPHSTIFFILADLFFTATLYISTLIIFKLISKEEVNIIKNIFLKTKT